MLLWHKTQLLSRVALFQTLTALLGFTVLTTQLERLPLNGDIMGTYVMDSLKKNVMVKRIPSGSLGALDSNLKLLYRGIKWYLNPVK